MYDCITTRSKGIAFIVHLKGLLHTVVSFQVFLSNNTNYQVSSNNIYLIIAICLQSYMVSSNL